MKKVLPLTALVLGLTGGVALADRGHGDHRGDHRSGAVVRDHRGSDRSNWRGNTVVVRDSNRSNWRDNNRGNWRGGSRVVVRNSPRYYDNYRHSVRRPIYVSRPVIRHRYYNYYQRPAVIFESYNTMPGYYWVAGQWQWSGAEWIWQPGHYEPDPNYIDEGY